MKVAKMSSIIQGMIDDGDADDVPLPEVKKAVLLKVIEFCEKHLVDPLPEIEKPLKSDNLSDVVPEFYGNFVDIKVEELYELTLAANYLDIKDLIQLCSAKTASLMRGKTVAEIREMFHLEDDFTDEERKEIEEENKWAQEAI